jgi:ABC-type phosphate transport system substrate-binding protein
VNELYIHLLRVKHASKQRYVADIDIYSHIYILGATFPQNVYEEATFAYRYVAEAQTVSYLSIGSTAGKCNIMGYWHTSNALQAGAPSSAVLKVDTAICTDTCTVALCGFNSAVTKRPDRLSRKPIVDFAGSDALLSATDYSIFPDLLMLPSLGGGVVPLYNLPSLPYPTATLVLSRATLTNIYFVLGGTFPQSVYEEATFAYRYVAEAQTVSYLSIGSTAGKCNIMGYWHTSNALQPGAPPLSVLKVDTAICTDTCTVALCGFSSAVTKRPDRLSRKPIVDFAGSDALLSATDYSIFPDLLMLPSLGGGVVPLYNLPSLSYPTATLVLSRATLTNIYLGMLFLILTYVPCCLIFLR